MVFTISTSLFNLNINNWIVVPPGGTNPAVIINVLGVTANINNGNMNNGTAVQAITMWNFVDATTINSSRAIDGAVLAIHASVTHTSPINGGLAALNHNMLGEIHVPFSQVCSMVFSEIVQVAPLSVPAAAMEPMGKEVIAFMRASQWACLRCTEKVCKCLCSITGICSCKSQRKSKKKTGRHQMCWQACC